MEQLDHQVNLFIPFGEIVIMFSNVISNSHQQFIGLWFLAIVYYYLYFYHIYPNGHE